MTRPDAEVERHRHGDPACVDREAVVEPLGEKHLSVMRSTFRILKRMTTPVPTRFSDEELQLIDALVLSGVADSRSAVIRKGVHHLAEVVRRSEIGASIASSYEQQPQAAEDDQLAMANAVAMTEAEPW